MIDLDIKWDYNDPFLLDKKVTGPDIDGLNHTNNGVYVNWCEQAAWAHSVALGLDLQDYQRLDRAMAIRRSEFDYIHASGLNDRVLVGTWLMTSGGKVSLERRFQFVRAVDGVTILRSRWELVCIAISTGKPKRMPAEFLNVYGPVVIES